MRGAVERHAAESAAHLGRSARARSADSRRAVQRPRPREHAIAPRSDPGGAQKGSDHHLFDPRHGAGGRDLRSHRDAAQGTESARRRSRRRFGAGTIRERSSSSRSSGERMQARSRSSRVWRRSRATAAPIASISATGADPVGVMRAVAAAVPPARLEVHRPSLEDIFIGLVT